MAPKAYNYYQLLQVDPEASQEVIEAAYRRLARLYHPDYNASTEAMAQMQEINCTYAVLRDPVQRRVYDQKLLVQRSEAIEQRWLGMSITPYTRTIILSAAVATLCLFAIFSNPATTRTATYQDSAPIQTAEAHRIQQAVMATLEAITTTKIAAGAPSQQDENLRKSSSFAIPAFTPTIRPTPATSATPVTSLTPVSAGINTQPTINQIAIEPLVARVVAQPTPIAQSTEGKTSAPEPLASEELSSQGQKTVGQLLKPDVTHHTLQDLLEMASGRLDRATDMDTDSASGNASTASAFATNQDTAQNQPEVTQGSIGGAIRVNPEVESAINASIARAVLVVTATPIPTLTGIPSARFVANSEGAIILPTPTSLTTPTPAATPTRQPTTPSAGTIIFPGENVDTKPRSQTMHTAQLILPVENAEGGGYQDFEWKATLEAEPNHGFELIFWHPGKDPMTDGFGLTAPTTGSSVQVNLDDLDDSLGNFFDDGEYNWGVLYVQTAPEYQRIKYLSEERTFRFSNFGTNRKTASKKKSPASGE